MEAAATPVEIAIPHATARPRTLRRKIADAKAQVPRPLADITSGANAAMPR
jgi:hypothetical protein